MPLFGTYHVTVTLIALAEELLIPIIAAYTPSLKKTFNLWLAIALIHVSGF